MVAEVWGAVPGLVKSDAVASGLPLLRRFCVAQALSHEDEPRHSFTSADCSEFEEDLIFFLLIHFLASL